MNGDSKSNPANSPFRSFAIVPAAGKSLRMGRPKLVMPWDQSTLIEHVITAWHASRVDRVVVIVRPDDLPLAKICRETGADVVIPNEEPPEMKISVRWGLNHVAQRYQPNPSDVWLLAPADMPGLSSHLVDRLLESHRIESPTVLVPRHGGKRGHPVLFPWTLASEISRLAAAEGINRLLDRHPTRFVDCDDPAVFQDVDTPDDYRRMRKR